MGEIKKRYRELSKFYHPDKETGDEETFMKIAKAYEAYVQPVECVPHLTGFSSVAYPTYIYVMKVVGCEFVWYTCAT